MKISIVGAGISGLATAYTLAKKNHVVRIIADKVSPDTTSDRAAAFWFPYHIRNDKRGIEWCKKSYSAYREFSGNPDTGVSMQQLLKVVRSGVEEQEKSWCSFMPAGSYRMLLPGELGRAYSSGYEVTVPLIETQLFLPWLAEELGKLKVVIEKKRIHSFGDIKNSDIIINCSALGASHLCHDKELIPVRGQVGLLAPTKNCSVYLDNELPLYIVHRKDAVIVGGTYEEGVTEAVTEPSTISRLLENAYRVFPELRKQKVLGDWAGVRPFRPLVRVEREGRIVHNYGHGGSGFTLAWGCAQEVASLIED